MSKGNAAIVVRLGARMHEAVRAEIERLNSNPLNPERTLSDWIREAIGAKIASRKAHAIRSRRSSERRRKRGQQKGCEHDSDKRDS